VVILFGSSSTPPPLSLVSKFSHSRYACLSPVKLTDVRGGGRWGADEDKELNHTTVRKKAWPSIYHSILSEFDTAVRRLLKK
jgi:hypothetical protein